MLVVILLSLVLAVWAMFSPLRFYPFTIGGMDALLWTSGLGLLLAILAAGRLRAPRTTRRSAGALLVGSLVMFALPFLFEYRPGGPLSAAFWNLALTGGSLTVLSVIGVVQVRNTSRAQGRRRRAAGR